MSVPAPGSSGGWVDQEGRYVRPGTAAPSPSRPRRSERRQNGIRQDAPDGPGHPATRAPGSPASWHRLAGIVVVGLALLVILLSPLGMRQTWETPSAQTAQFRSTAAYQLEPGHPYDLYAQTPLPEETCQVSPDARGAGGVRTMDTDRDSAVVQHGQLWTPVHTFQVSSAGQYRISCDADQVILMADPQQIPEEHLRDASTDIRLTAQMASMVGVLALILGVILWAVGNARRRRRPGEARWRVGRGLTLLAVAALTVAIGLMALPVSRGLPGGQAFTGSASVQLPADTVVNIYREDWMSGPYPQECTVEAADPQATGTVQALPLDTTSAAAASDDVLRPVTTVRTAGSGEYRVSCPDGKPAVVGTEHRLWTEDLGLVPDAVTTSAGHLLMIGLLCLPVGVVLWIIGRRRVFGKGRTTWV